jgi:glycosyltransferase involved in cell wall biosynthesis
MIRRAGRPLVPRATLSDADWLRRRSGGTMPTGAVLLHAPSAAFQAPGGGERQLVATGRALEDLGVSVRPFVSWTDRLPRARLLHLFGMSPEGLSLARVARARGVPVVLSPICWLEPRSLWALRPSCTRGARDLAAWAMRRACPFGLSWRGELLRHADAILPNSRAEADQLVRLFRADPERIAVVPNGVDPRFAEGDADHVADEAPASPFVLYAGRIEPRKNVLNLVRAARLASLPLVVLGDAVPGHEAYARACREGAGPTTTFRPGLAHDDPRLAAWYAAARVLALPSWFETPGLAALEGALAGCAVVITPHGATREYFGSLARYARPDRVGEIAAALVAAMREGPPAGLASHVASEYLWAAIARRTAEVYARAAR